MKKGWAQIQTLANSVVEKANMRKSRMAVVAVAVLTAFFVLQFYFVRELVAAELLFGIAFAILLALGCLAYLVGSVGERGLEFAETGVRQERVANSCDFILLERNTRATSFQGAI